MKEIWGCRKLQKYNRGFLSTINLISGIYLVMLLLLFSVAFGTIDKSNVSIWQTAVSS